MAKKTSRQLGLSPAHPDTGPLDSRTRSTDHPWDPSWPDLVGTEPPSEQSLVPALDLGGKEAESVPLHRLSVLSKPLNLLSSNFTSFTHFIDQTHRAIFQALEPGKAECAFYISTS